MQQILCTTCKKKNDIFNKLHKLNKILEICKRLDVANIKYTERISVDTISTKCLVGLPCGELKIDDSKINNKLITISNYIPTIAMNEQAYHNVLSLLRGDFPCTYKSLEYAHRKLFTK